MKHLQHFLLTINFSIFSSTAVFSQANYFNGLKIADSLFSQSNYSEANSVYSKILGKNPEDSIKTEIYIKKGQICSFLNLADSGLYYEQKALVALKPGSRKSYTLGNIGNIYFDKNNYDEAHHYFSEALEASVSMQDSARAYLCLAVLFTKQKKFDTAYSLVQSHLVKFPPAANPYLKLYIEQTSGVYFLEKKIYDSALLHLKAALSSATNPRLRANVANDIAECLLKTGRASEAMKYVDTSVSENAMINYSQNSLVNFDTYSRLYFSLRDYKKAFLYSDSARHLSDSFFDVTSNNARLEAEAKYRNQQTLAEKAVAEKEVSIKQRNLVITLFGLGFVALIAFVSLRISRARKKSNTILTLQKKQVQQLADELSVANDTKARLFSTIGHDLRSPVSSLYALLKMEELKGKSQNDEMSGHTIQLLDTLEELLTWSKSQMEGFKLQPVKINSKEFFDELVQFYAPAAQQKNISFRNQSADLIVKTDENILKAILRNVISNAVAHTSTGNTIELTAEPGAGEKIVFSVKNPCSEESFSRFKMNFEGAEIKSNAHGFGIVLIKEFAQKIHADITLTYSGDHAVLCVLL